MATNSVRVDTDERVAKLTVPKVAVQPLKLKLRRMGADDANALCKLFSGRDRLMLDGTPATTWHFAPSQVDSPSGIILRSGREEIALCINDDGLCDPLGERAWSDYGADSQPLAWLLSHHTIIESLSRLLGEPFLPRERGDAGRPAGVSLSILVGFIVETDDGRVTRGALGLSPAMTARLAAHAGWRPRTNAIAHWLSLPAQLRIVSRIERFPLSELRATEVGDVLVLGRRQHCWSMLRVQRVGARSSPLLPGAWSAGYDGSHLLIRAALPPEEAQVLSRPAEDALFSRPAIEGLLNSKREKDMSETPATQPTDTGSADALARTPITLEFELGSLTLPLGELANLKPGFVFQLPIKLEDARVVIRAGGRRVGQGELVSVGEVLGVQVTALDGDGLQ